MAPRWLHNLLRTEHDVDAQSMQADAARRGAVPISMVTYGTQVTIAGTIASLVLRPSDTVQALEAEIFDGTGRLTIVWVGRHRIVGIDPGRGITVHGRVVLDGDIRRMYNPRYELHPRMGAA